MSASPAELAAAVLHRGSAVAAVDDGPDRTWRDRAPDEAVLLIELCRWLEGCHRNSRRAPLVAVRRFVRIVVGRAQAELAGPGAPLDPAPARLDEDAVVALLERCYREAGAGRGSTWTFGPGPAPGGRRPASTSGTSSRPTVAATSGRASTVPSA